MHIVKVSPKERDDIKIQISVQPQNIQSIRTTFTACEKWQPIANHQQVTISWIADNEGFMSMQFSSYRFLNSFTVTRSPKHPGTLVSKPKLMII